MGKWSRLIDQKYPILSKIAAFEPQSTNRLAYMAALGFMLKRKPQLGKFASSIMYRTLGKTLPKNIESAAPLPGITMQYASKYYEQIKRVGYDGTKKNLGNKLFEAILKAESGLIISQHEFEEMWTLLKTKDKKIYLEIPEMLEELRQLKTESVANDDLEFILMAGERRSYNANQIYRNPAWRKTDAKGTMRMHPSDTEALEIGTGTGAEVVCTSAIGSIRAFVEIDASVRPKVVTLPHGYGLRVSE